MPPATFQSPEADRDMPPVIKSSAIFVPSYYSSGHDHDMIKNLSGDISWPSFFVKLVRIAIWHKIDRGASVPRLIFRLISNIVFVLTCYICWHISILLAFCNEVS